MAQRSRLRRGVVSNSRRRGMGALSLWPLGVDCSVGMDLGGRRALGICSVSLRTLAEVGGGWCWVPGPVVVRPVYAPALVVFVGGPRFGATLSFGGGGGVGWFPLGPREVYVPPYRTSERYVQRVNVTNTTVNVVNVTNVYNNVNVNNVTYMHQKNVQAVTVVSHDTFVNARPVAAANVRVNQQQMREVQVQRNFTMAPVQKSVVGAAPVASARPPAAVMQRQIVAKETPPTPRPSFNNTPQQQRSFRPANAPPQQPMQSRPAQPGQPPVPQRGQQQMQQQEPQRQPQFRPPQGQQPPPQQGQPPVPQRGQQQQQMQQQQPQQQPQFRPPQGQQPPPQQGQPPVPQRGQQQQQMQQQEPQRQPQSRPPQPPPQQQNPVRMAPPARANDDTYRPHQFEKPPAPPQQANPPARTEKEPPKSQERDSKKGDDKDRK